MHCIFSALLLHAELALIRLNNSLHSFRHWSPVAPVPPPAAVGVAVELAPALDPAALARPAHFCRSLLTRAASAPTQR